MKKLSLALIISILMPYSVAHADTICQWDNVRDGASFGSISDRKNLTNVRDCANALGQYMLRWEPLRGSTMFDGIVILKEENGTVIGQCTTKTVKAITDRERSRLPFFVAVDTEDEQREWRKKYPFTPVMMGDESVQYLRTKEWQERYAKYFTVECETPLL